MDSKHSRKNAALAPHGNPATTRAALAARFPAYTQRFWTWLSGIAMPSEMKRKPWSPWRHVVVTLATLAGASVIGIQCAQDLYVSAIHIFA